MYVVRDIFHLHFGRFQEAKGLMKESMDKKMMPEEPSFRLLSDFTGDSYRMIMEISFPSLAEYEKSLTTAMTNPDFKGWYERFKPLVISSHREILKEVALK